MFKKKIIYDLCNVYKKYFYICSQKKKKKRRIIKFLYSIFTLEKEIKDIFIYNYNLLNINLFKYHQINTEFNNLFTFFFFNNLLFTLSKQQKILLLNIIILLNLHNSTIMILINYSPLMFIPMTVIVIIKMNVIIDAQKALDSYGTYHQRYPNLPAPGHSPEYYPIWMRS